MFGNGERSAPAHIEDPRAFDLEPISPEDAARWEAFATDATGGYDFNNVLAAWVDPRVTSPHLRERMAMILTSPMGAYAKYPYGSSTDSVGRLNYYLSLDDGGTESTFATAAVSQPQLANELALAMIAWRKAPLVRWNDFDRQAYNDILTMIEPTLESSDPDLMWRLPYAPLIGDVQQPQDVRIDPDEQAKYRARSLQLSIGGNVLLEIEDEISQMEGYSDHTSGLVRQLFAELDAQDEGDAKAMHYKRDTLNDIATYVRNSVKTSTINSGLLNHLLKELIAREDQFNVTDKLGFMMNEKDELIDVALAASDDEICDYLLTHHFVPQLFPAVHDGIRFWPPIVNDDARGAVAWLSERYADDQSQEAKIIVERCLSLLTNYDLKVAAQHARRERKKQADLAARELLFDAA